MGQYLCFPVIFRGGTRGRAVNPHLCYNTEKFQTRYAERDEDSTSLVIGKPELAIRYLLTCHILQQPVGFFIGRYHLVNKYLSQSSEAFPGLDHECRREVLVPYLDFI
jgi:hypothetical protein